MVCSVIEDQKKFYDFSRIVWSSAQSLAFMLNSQMTSTKLSTEQFVANFKPLSQSMNQMLKGFLKPFLHSFEQKSLAVKVIEGNYIPAWVSTDWAIF